MSTQEVLTSSTITNLLNKESFTLSSYHGIEIMIRDADGFVNATKIVVNFNKMEHKRRQLYTFFKSQEYAELEEELRKNITYQNFGSLYYDLESGYSKQVSGRYVHPDLIHHIAHWTSPKYAVKVGNIMKLLNQREQITKETLDDYTQSLRNELEQLKIEHTDYVDTHQPRLCPKDKEIYCIMLYAEEITLEQYEVHAVRRMKQYFGKKLREIKNSPKCLYYRETLPVSTSLFHVFADRLDAKGIESKNLIFIIDSVDQYDLIIETMNEVIDEMKI
jgi:hypothetical protein